MFAARTQLALDHQKVIATAPADKQYDLRQIAAAACLAAYDAGGHINFYLDSEDFYYR